MEAASGGGAGLEFDKDNVVAMSFVAAASNLRSRVFKVKNKRNRVPCPIILLFEVLLTKHVCTSITANGTNYF